MKDLTGKRRVDPFPVDDPLTYGELDPLCRSLRALMAVLADTDAVVAFPVGLVPDYVPAEIAAGWRLRPDFNPDPSTGTVLMSCEWVAAPDIPRPVLP